jgi:hypothetical protein
MDFLSFLAVAGVPSLKKKEEVATARHAPAPLSEAAASHARPPICFASLKEHPIDEDLLPSRCSLALSWSQQPLQLYNIYLTHPLGRIRWRDRDRASPKILNKLVSLTLLGLNIPISNRIPPPHSPGT